MTSVMTSMGSAAAGRARAPIADNRGMKVLADKGVVLCGCVLMWRADAATVVWLLLAVTISGLEVVAEHWRWFAAVPAAYLLAAALAAAPAVGAPLALYDLARASTGRPPWQRLAAASVCAPITAVMVVGGEPTSAYTAALGAVAALLALRTRQGEATRQNLNAARDDLRERVLALQNANTRMLQMQDDELRAAALSERTRIAREIHDGVGHLLTRLLLQIKALQITHREKPGVVADLAALNDGLDEALDSMRCSVHALSEQGEDLAVALNLLGSRSGIAKVGVDCSLEAEPPRAVSRCVTAVVREALTNAARHGGAASARVTVTDYPAFWQVTVDNDGAVPSGDADPGVGAPGFGASPGGAPQNLREGHGGVPSGGAARPGLGLRAMADRIEALGGTVRITPRPRFTVFATIPKDQEGAV